MCILNENFSYFFKVKINLVHFTVPMILNVCLASKSQTKYLNTLIFTCHKKSYLKTLLSTVKSNSELLPNMFGKLIIPFISTTNPTA